MPRRVQLRRLSGWKMPENTSSVARPHALGNPFRVGEHATNKEHAASLFEQCVLNVERDPYYEQIWTQAGGDPVVLSHLARKTPGFIEPYRGKNLACFCGEGPCHATFLLEWLNG